MYIARIMWQYKPVSTSTNWQNPNAPQHSFYRSTPLVVTSNQKETDLNRAMCATTGIRTDAQYRKYMQDNAKSIMKHNLDTYSQQNTDNSLANSSNINAVTWATHVPATGFASIGKLGPHS